MTGRDIVFTWNSLVKHSNVVISDKPRAVIVSQVLLTWKNKQNFLILMGGSLFVIINHDLYTYILQKKIHKDNKETLFNRKYVMVLFS